ncbi:hypothetical protein [Mesobacillus subterraneus]|uniref:Uncharacterized protein n=1 Tax=Mesobacillus subterraneus TaxID=285983 RepID=A0A3R9EAP4_9BACI|nr:hypothetical protein [Mesobacillus subterraneus]RSD27620.1 hypothetical protein EJA10_07500 [Mesobacillus subterraneus]
MFCKECNGILDVIRIEEYPEGFKDIIGYKRLCDVQCLSCGNIYYSQPYDWGKSVNEVRNLNIAKKRRSNN